MNQPDKKLNFALIGVGGFIAVRHLRAIKYLGHNLLSSLDPNDSVGIIDSYFPESNFFIEFERFDRHIDKLRRSGEKINYISICSPNYLHDAHIRFALRNGADAICEKPVVMNPWNVDALQQIEQETGRKINNILQLRLHPSIQELQKRIATWPSDKLYDIELTYITSRGKWYYISWKGDVMKSGGIATNIGVHFFDMLTWIFGKPLKNIVHLMQTDKAAGFLLLEKARVKWFLSIDSNDLPESALANNKRTYRSLKLNNEEIEFSDGFTDLHTISYQKIIENKGFTLDDARTAIETVFTIRNAVVEPLKGEYHEILKK